MTGGTILQKTSDHLGVAVRNIDDTLPFYLDILGGKLMDRYTNNIHGFDVHVAAVHVSGMHVELLEPTNRESPIARFMRQYSSETAGRL